MRMEQGDNLKEGIKETDVKVLVLVESKENHYFNFHISYLFLLAFAFQV